MKALGFYLACDFEVSPDWLGWDREWLLLTKRVSVKKTPAYVGPGSAGIPAMIPLRLPGAERLGGER